MTIRAEVEGIGTLEFPDGTSPEVIQATVKKAVAGAYQTPSQRRGENMDERMAKLPPARNILSSVAHGGLDTAQAVAELASRGATALGMPPGTDMPFLASPEVVQASTDKARQDVNRVLGPPNPQGFDLPRIGASAALSAPYMGPVGTAPSMVGRAGQAARAGAIGGALQPAGEGDFLKTKAMQVGAGGVTGALAQPALEFGAQGVANIANRVASRAKGMVADSSDELARSIAMQTVRAQGGQWAELNENAQKSLIQGVQEALKKYGGVNSAALARQADFAQLGVEPLQPWVTRDPIQWGKYKNLEGTDAGDPLKVAKAKLTETLANKMEGLRGPGTGDAFTSGVRAQDAISRHLSALEGRVKQGYDTFQQKAPNVSADGRRLAASAFDALDADMAHSFLPEGLRGALNDLATGKLPATPTVLYQLQKRANAAARAGGNEGYAAGVVSRAIDGEFDRFADEFTVVGPEMQEAVAALKAGRAAHRTLKTQEEAMPALKAVSEGKFAAEDFFNRYVIGGDVKDVAALWANIPSGEMKQAARSQMIDYLKQAANQNEFGHAKLKAMLEAPGMPQKISIIVGHKELETLRRIQRAAENSTKTPSGARFNTSGTATELLNILNRSTGIPFVGPMVTGPLQTAAKQAQVGGLLQPAPLGQAPLDPVMEELLRRSRRGIGLLSPAFGVGAAGELTR